MGFPCPFYGTPTFEGVEQEQPVNVLIYGSTTNVGLFAAQLVRIAERNAGKKIRLIGAASASKHAMLREAPYQYDILVDYRKSSWIEEVRQATGGSGVLYAIDAVSSGSTVADVESTLSANGKFAAYRTPSIGNFDVTALEIKPVIGAVWEGLGVGIEYHGKCIIVLTLVRLLSNAYAKVPICPQIRRRANSQLLSSSLSARVRLQISTSSNQFLFVLCQVESRRLPPMVSACFGNRPWTPGMVHGGAWRLISGRSAQRSWFTRYKLSTSRHYFCVVRYRGHFPWLWIYTMSVPSVSTCHLG